MTTERFWPESSVVDQYLATAAADHPGHKILDLAVWYTIIQNYANRCHIQFLGQPFRVHFFLVARSQFGKSSTIKFGLNKVLGTYRQSVGGPEYDPQFINIGGQNTAAGLMDAFNEVSDPYGHQILSTWTDETTYVFPKMSGRREQDIAALLANVFFGDRNDRFVRERGKKKDSVEHPLINACFPATPDQYAQLMKNSSSSDILKRFILLAPAQGDGRKTSRFTGVQSLDKIVETFGQWLNFTDTNRGIPKCPANITCPVALLEKFESLFAERISQAAAREDEQRFFWSKQSDILSIAALNALSRSSMQIAESDILQAWSLLLFSWESLLRLSEDPLIQAEEQVLTTPRRERRAVIERMVEIVTAAGKKGASRSDIRLKTWSFRYYSSEEIDKFFDFVRDEIDDVYLLPIDTVKADGKHLTKYLYFAKSVWPIEEAARELPISRPVWHAEASGFKDALGNIHAELKDCLGYRPSWDVSIPTPSKVSAAGG